MCSRCGECDFADRICIQSANPDFVSWDPTHGRSIEAKRLIGQEQMNSDVSRNMFWRGLHGKGGKETRGEGWEWWAEGEIKGGKTHQRREKMKRTVPRNVTLLEIEGKKESWRGWRPGSARTREVEIRESKVVNDYYKQTERKAKRKRVSEREKKRERGKRKDEIKGKSDSFMSKFVISLFFLAFWRKHAHGII